MKKTLYICLWSLKLFILVHAPHFFGGCISWQTVSPSVSNTSNVTIQLNQRYTMVNSMQPCSALVGPVGSLICLLGCGSPTTSISSQGVCTNFDFGFQVTVSKSAKVLTYPIGSRLLLGTQSSNWLALVSGIKAWSLITYIDLSIRSDTGRINSSPTSPMAPVVIVPANTQQVLRIPMTDVDQDIVKCRWAQNSTIIASTAINECAGVCQDVPGASLYSTSNLDNNCTLVFTTTVIGYYIVAIQIEDFMPTQPNSTALSSVPLQFAINCVPNTCDTPTIVGSLTNNAVIYVQANVSFSTVVIAQTGCNGTSINRFLTINLPDGTASTSSIIQLSPVLYSTTLTWIPSYNQIGTSQLYCTIAANSNSLQSNEYCLNFIVVAPTSVTTNSSPITITTLYTQSLDLNLLLGLILGLGLPLCFLLILLTICFLYPKWCAQSFWAKLRHQLWREEKTCRTCESRYTYATLNQRETMNNNTQPNYHEQYINPRQSLNQSELQINNLLNSTLTLSHDFNVPKITSPTSNVMPLPVGTPINTNKSYLFSLYTEQNNKMPTPS